VHTDQGLATTLSGNPGVHINDLAADEVAKAAIAVRKAEHAQHLFAAEGGRINYADKATEWATNRDVRAYLLDKMPSKDRARLMESLKPGSPDRKRFNDTLREAYDFGLMTRPATAPASGVVNAAK
jgi:hypothetical protein